MLQLNILFSLSYTTLSYMETCRAAYTHLNINVPLECANMLPFGVIESDNISTFIPVLLPTNA